MAYDVIVHLAIKARLVELDVDGASMKIGLSVTKGNGRCSTDKATTLRPPGMLLVLNGRYASQSSISNTCMLRFFTDVINVLIAYTLNKLPNQVDNVGGVEQRAKLYQYFNEEYGTNPDALTEPGLMRGACQSLIRGYALSKTPMEDAADLAKNYPLTGCNTIFARQRAWCFDVTQVDHAVNNGNKDFFETWNKWARYITASPVQVHQLIMPCSRRGCSISI